MKFEFCYVGKTKESYLKEGIEVYTKRLKHYCTFSEVCIPDIKNGGKLKSDQLKVKEGEELLKRLNKEDCLVLLDEKGKRFTSVSFSKQIERMMQMPYKRIVFQVGGAFGFSEAVYERANSKIALSEMTFSHQMIRLFFVEQLYRGFSIVRGEKYHNF